MYCIAERNRNMFDLTEFNEESQIILQRSINARKCRECMAEIHIMQSNFQKASILYFEIEEVSKGVLCLLASLDFDGLRNKVKDIVKQNGHLTYSIGWEFVCKLIMHTINKSSIEYTVSDYNTLTPLNDFQLKCIDKLRQYINT